MKVWNLHFFCNSVVLGVLWMLDFVFFGYGVVGSGVYMVGCGFVVGSIFRFSAVFFFQGWWCF